MHRKLLRLLVPAALATVIATGVAFAGGHFGGGKGERAGIKPAPADARFTTIHESELGLEGLTGDRRGNLYSAARVANGPCPVVRVPVSGGEAVVVGTIPAQCGPAGLAFDDDGRLYVADGGDGQVHVLTPNADDPPLASVFASGVPGANGLAFDRRGNLWVSDGVTSQGRVWRVDSNGTPTEVFRIQPMVNEVNLDANGVGGVGRDPRSAPPATVRITPTSRQAANMEGSQHLVANGLAFTEDGTLFVADTARGAIWKVELGRNGRLRSPVFCDTTFTENTLCLDNVFVAHPYLDGADGIALDRAGNIWVAANERNAIVVVTRHGRVIEFFRNAPEPNPETGLRNEGPLEFPTSPFLLGRKLCLTHSDGSRRDNFPNTGGEVGPDETAVAKISCLDQTLAVPGLPLPVD
jgi:sugar lactone lactonase YvrE